MGLVRKAVEDKKQHKKFRAKSENILDAAWGKFLQRLGSKAENAGSATIAIEPRGTSQECSGCGMVVKKGVEERTHSCPYCGLVLDRDENAARNILSRGLQTERTVLSGSRQVGVLPVPNREATPL